MAPSNIESFPWASSRSSHITPQGKHELQFPPECPLIISFHEFSDDHCVVPNRHDHLEISYVYEGRGGFALENKVYPLDPGDAVVVGTREFHRMHVDDGQSAKLICIHFMPELVYTPGGSPLDFEYLRPFYPRKDSLSKQSSGISTSRNSSSRFDNENSSGNARPSQGLSSCCKNLSKSDPSCFEPI